MTLNRALTYGTIIVALIIVGAFVIGFANAPLPQKDAPVIPGLIAAAIIVAGMAGFAWTTLNGYTMSRTRMENTSYPKIITDMPITTPLPDSMHGIDQTLKAEGYALTSERHGIKNADGTPVITWHYRTVDSTAHALVALSPNGKDAGLVVTTYFEDEMQLITRLSRTIPKIEQEGFENHSVERLEDVIKVHNRHIQRLASEHGKPLKLITFEEEEHFSEKTYSLTKTFMFHAMWRRLLTWLIVVEGMGLLALINGLAQMFNPAASSVRGLTILVGGALVIGTLGVVSIVALRRTSRERPAGH